MRDSIVGEALAAASILLIGAAGLIFFFGTPVWLALGIFGVAGFLVGASGR
jgi:hypothetical protein